MRFGGSSDARDVAKQHSRNAKIVFAIISVSLFAVFAFQVVYHAVRTSATVDEPAHILAGYRHLQCGDYGINPEHPPMLKMLATVPLLFKADLALPPWDCGSKVTSKFDSFLYGQRFLTQNGIDEMVIPSRVAASFMALLLAAVVFAAAWTMFGRWEAVIALAVLAFEPNLIANGALVTTDVALTATGITAVFALYLYCESPSWVRFASLGIALGLLLAAKHSAVLFLPSLLILLITDTIILRKSEVSGGKRLLRQFGVLAGAGLIALVLLWSFYGFRYRPIPNAEANTVSPAKFITENARPEMVNSLSAKIVTGVEWAHILPESYVLGMADIVAMGSRNMYLFDTAYPTGQWFYFPVSFLVKSSVALLLLLPVGFLVAFFKRDKRREMLYLLLPPLLFFTVALTSGTNIGVRHILPVYPFFIIVGAAGAVWLCSRFSAFRYVLIVLLIYHAFATISVAPHYYAFANDFWGGTYNTYHIFKDPNLDFGQNIKFVDEYVRREKIADCWATLPALTVLNAPMRPCRLLPPGPVLAGVSDGLDDPLPPVIEGTVILTALAFPPRGGPEYLPIVERTPVDRIGPGVFVYRGTFEAPLLSALSYSTRADQLTRLKRFDEAVTDASRAVELAPDDPRPHLSLGLALAGSGRSEGAKREFETAAEQARPNPLFRNTEVRANREIKRLGNDVR